MSERRAVILTVAIEGLSQADAARSYGVSESQVSRWLARWRVEGDAAFEPRSRRPRRSPIATRAEVVDLIVNLRIDLAAQGLDAGPATATTGELQTQLDRFVHHDRIDTTGTITVRRAEQLRHLTLDPTRDYQPRQNWQGPNP
jgi:transposase